MDQIHRHLSDYQIRVLLQGHCHWTLNRSQVQEI